MIARCKVCGSEPEARFASEPAPHVTSGSLSVFWMVCRGCGQMTAPGYAHCIAQRNWNSAQEFQTTDKTDDGEHEAQ